MFWTRFKAAVIFVPLMLIIIYIGGITFDLFILLILGVAAWESWRICKLLGYQVSFAVILGGVLLLAIHRIIFDLKFSDWIISSLVMLVAIYSLIQYESNDQHSASKFFIHIGIILYLGWVGSYFFTLRGIDNGIIGRWYMLTVIPVTWLIDMGAYTFGKPWGKHKMFPKLSPNKSWEGFIGGILFGILSGILLSLLWKKWLPTFTIWQGAMLGFVLAVLTPIGDLFISLLKRTVKVKDTSNLIPGHGGILDRIDTWIWGCLIGYYLLQVLQ